MKEREDEEKVKHITMLYETDLGNFEIDLRPFSRKQFEALGRKHRKPITNKKTRQTEYEINPDTYYPDLYSRLVKDIRGLTNDVFKLLTHQVINGKDTSPVPFTMKNVVRMARESVSFSNFCEGIAVDFD